MNSGQTADKPKLRQKEKPTKGFVKPNVSYAYGDPYGNRTQYCGYRERHSRAHLTIRKPTRRAVCRPRQSKNGHTENGAVYRYYITKLFFCQPFSTFADFFTKKPLTFFRRCDIIFIVIETWLSLVERCVRDAEVVGSNPVVSTK